MPQAIEDHLAHDRVVAVERIAATGVIAILLAAVLQHVVDAVLQAFEAERRTLLVAFGRMVENHVEDHLDVRRVQCPHHLLELADLGPGLAAHGISAVRCEEANRVVAPVVGPGRAIAETIEDRILVHRHELDRRDAQRLQVGNLLDDALVRARVFDLAARRLREAADVGLVNDRLRQVAAEMAIALPIELVADHHAFRRTQDAAVGRQEIAGQGLAIGVDQAGLGVEAVSPQRFMGTVSLEVIKLPRGGSRDKHAPNMAPAVQIGIELDDVRRLGIVDAVVEQNAHGGRAAAEDDELHPAIMNNRSIRKGVRELQCRLPLRHGGRLNGATCVERNIRSIARIDIKRHLFSPIAESGVVDERPAPGNTARHPPISPLLRPHGYRKMKLAMGSVTPLLTASLPSSRFKWQLRPDGQIPKTPTRSPMAGSGSAEKGDCNRGTRKRHRAIASPVAFRPEDKASRWTEQAKSGRHREDHGFSGLKTAWQSWHDWFSLSIAAVAPGSSPA